MASPPPAAAAAGACEHTGSGHCCTPAPPQPPSQQQQQQQDAGTPTAAASAAQAAATEAAAALAASASSSSSSSWALKGEGNANLVLGYAGSDPALVGRVLRLRKPPAHRAHQEHQQHDAGSSKGQRASCCGLPATSTPAAADTPAAAGSVEELEARIWGPVIPAWRQLDPMQRELAFVRSVLAPRFAGCACRLAVASAVPVPPPPALLRHLEQQQQLQQQRVQEGVLGLLMQDASVLQPEELPPGWRPVGRCLCVEIKPKSGAQGAAGVSAQHEQRHEQQQQPRFVQHQLLKHLQGKAPRMSYYNPQHLFGSSSTGSSSRGGCDDRGPEQQQQQSQRQQAALLALLECPSNNLKLFVDGQRLPLKAACSRSSSSSGRDTAPCVQQRLAALGSLLQHVPADCLLLPDGPRQCAPQQQQQQQQQQDGSARERLLCRLLAGVLAASGVLPPLLALQQLDARGVAACHQLFCELLQQQQQQDEQQQDAAVRDEQLAVLRDYLTAATAKDCALMVVLQQVGEVAADRPPAAAPSQAAAAAGQQLPHASSRSGSSSSGVQLFADGPTAACFAWRVTLVDLDVKPAAKLPTHWRLARDIHHAVFSAAAAAGEAAAAEAAGEAGGGSNSSSGSGSALLAHVADAAVWLAGAEAFLAAGSSGRSG